MDRHNRKNGGRGGGSGPRRARRRRGRHRILGHRGVEAGIPEPAGRRIPGPDQGPGQAAVPGEAGPAAHRPAGERSGGERPGRSRPTAAAGAGAAKEAASVEAPADAAEGGPAAERGAGAAVGQRSSSGSAARRRRRRRPSGASDAARATTPETSSNGDEEEAAVSGSEVSLEEQAELAEAFTRGLVERFGLPATVSARAEGDDDVMVDIAGDDLGLLIGPKAATVDALQELVRTAVQRRIGGHGARIHVDVAGYRARRQEALAEFARQAAQRALESGRDQVFEPRSPVDRKIVH